MTLTYVHNLSSSGFAAKGLSTKNDEGEFTKVSLVMVGVVTQRKQLQLKDRDLAVDIYDVVS